MRDATSLAASCGILLLLFVGACSEPTPPPGTPEQLLVASGDGQSVPVGALLPQPIVVRVLDGEGVGVPGVSVTASLPYGDGAADPDEVETDVNGEARVTWTLSTAPGPNALILATTDLSTRAVAIGTRHPVTLYPATGDSILYGGRFFTAPVTVDSTALVAVVRSGEVYLYYAGLGGDLPPLSQDLSVRSVRHRVAFVRQHWAPASAQLVLPTPRRVAIEIAGVSIEESSNGHYTFRNTVRRFVGLKFTPTGASRKVLLPQRGDLISFEFSNLFSDPLHLITFMEQPTYSRAITATTRCEAFGSIVNIPFNPLGLPATVWATLQPELRSAIESDAAWFGAVNRADAIQLYLEIGGDIVGFLLSGAPCLDQVVAVGTDFASVGFTADLLAAQDAEIAVDVARELLDEVAGEIAICACSVSSFWLCEVVVELTDVLGLATQIIDDGVLRPFDIAATSVYGTTILEAGGAGVPPHVVTLPAASVDAPTAELHASVNPNGSTTEAWFEWATDPALTAVSQTPSFNLGAGTTDQPFTAEIPVDAGQTYYFRAAASSSAGVTRGEILIFAASDPGRGLIHVSGDGQTGIPGLALPQPIVVQALNENGVPLPNAEVTFLVTGGGGTAEPGIALTDASGLAQTTWTLGPSAGPNALQANAPSLGSSLTLSATGEPDDGWEFAPQSTGERFQSSPAIATDGTIFIPTTNTSVLDHGRLYAIRPDGQSVWNEPFPVGGDQAPAISEDDELIHVGEDEKLYVIDRASGTELCNVSLDGFSATSPALNGDTAYIATGQQGGTIFAVKISRPCGILWEFERPAIGLGFQSPPAVADDGSIYAASWETDSAYALNPNGSLRWGFQAREFFLSSPAIAGDILYIGGGTTFYALDRITGQLRWTRVLGGEVNSSPALGSDGKVFVGADDGRLYGFTSSGEPVWPPGNSWDPPNRSSPAVGSDGTIYFAPTDAEIVGVSPLNGEVVWSYPTGGGAGSSNSFSPSLAGGRVYVGRGNIFFAIPAPTSGLATSSWPKFRHDLRNTGRAGAPLASIRVSRD